MNSYNKDMDSGSGEEDNRKTDARNNSDRLSYEPNRSDMASQPAFRVPAGTFTSFQKSQNAVSRKNKDKKNKGKTNFAPVAAEHIKEFGEHKLIEYRSPSQQVSKKRRADPPSSVPAVLIHSVPKNQNVESRRLSNDASSKTDEPSKEMLEIRELRKSLHDELRGVSNSKIEQVTQNLKDYKNEFKEFQISLGTIQPNLERLRKDVDKEKRLRTEVTSDVKDLKQKVDIAQEETIGRVYKLETQITEIQTQYTDLKGVVDKVKMIDVVPETVVHTVDTKQNVLDAFNELKKYTDTRFDLAATQMETLQTRITENRSKLDTFNHSVSQIPGLLQYNEQALVINRQATELRTSQFREMQTNILAATKQELSKQADDFSQQILGVRTEIDQDIKNLAKNKPDDTYMTAKMSNKQTEVFREELMTVRTTLLEKIEQAITARTTNDTEISTKQARDTEQQLQDVRRLLQEVQITVDQHTLAGDTHVGPQKIEEMLNEKFKDVQHALEVAVGDKFERERTQNDSKITGTSTRQAAELQKELDDIKSIMLDLKQKQSDSQNKRKEREQRESVVVAEEINKRTNEDKVRDARILQDDLKRQERETATLESLEHNFRTKLTEEINRIKANDAERVATMQREEGARKEREELQIAEIKELSSRLTTQLEEQKKIESERTERLKTAEEEKKRHEQARVEKARLDKERADEIARMQHESVVKAEEERKKTQDQAVQEAQEAQKARDAQDAQEAEQAEQAQKLKIQRQSAEQSQDDQEALARAGQLASNPKIIPDKSSFKSNFNNKSVMISDAAKVKDGKDIWVRLEKEKSWVKGKVVKSYKLNFSVVIALWIIHTTDKWGHMTLIDPKDSKLVYWLRVGLNFKWGVLYRYSATFNARSILNRLLLEDVVDEKPSSGQFVDRVFQKEPHFKYEKDGREWVEPPMYTSIPALVAKERAHIFRNYQSSLHDVVSNVSDLGLPRNNSFFNV